FRYGNNFQREYKTYGTSGDEGCRRPTAPERLGRSALSAAHVGIDSAGGRLLRRSTPGPERATGDPSPEPAIAPHLLRCVCSTPSVLSCINARTSAPQQLRPQENPCPPGATGGNGCCGPRSG